VLSIRCSFQSNWSLFVNILRQSKHCRIRMYWGINSNIKQTCLSSILFHNWISNNVINTTQRLQKLVIILIGSLFFSWKDWKKKENYYLTQILYYAHIKIGCIQIRNWNFPFIWFEKVVMMIIIRKVWEIFACSIQFSSYVFDSGYAVFCDVFLLLDAPLMTLYFLVLFVSVHLTM